MTNERYSKVLAISIMFLSLNFIPLKATTLQAADQKACLGPKESKAFAVYLHGFEDPSTQSPEEVSNRNILQQLGHELSIRIALPISPSICEGKHRCWPGKSSTEVLQTFESIHSMSEACIPPKTPYTLIGFSNGGYYAFKLFKVHHDTQLKHIIAVGSAGMWDPQEDKPSPFSSFHLMIGRREITYPSAKNLALSLKKSITDFTLWETPGGHKLDYGALKKLLASLKT